MGAMSELTKKLISYYILRHRTFQNFIIEAMSSDIFFATSSGDGDQTIVHNNYKKKHAMMMF